MTARKPLLLIVFLLFVSLLSASEIKDGYLRLILNERNGTFLLYFLTDPGSARYEALFNTSLPSASFLALNVDGQVYRLGESRVFRTSYERVEGNPALIFESSSLKISQIFSPVKTANSPVVNGVKITVNIENKSFQRASVGLRMLIDTHLGERRGDVPFLTDNLVITKELLIEGRSGEKFWLSRSQTVALMGSILNPLDNNSRPPDFVHIANWKRLNDVPWRLQYYEGRSLSYIPYSIRDSAVCYYYEPAVLESRKTFSYTIFLTTEDIEWYSSATVPPPSQSADASGTQSQTEVSMTTEDAPPVNFAALEEEAASRAAAYYDDADLLFLISLQNLLDQFLAGEINLNEQDLAEIERSINRLKNRN